MVRTCGWGCGRGIPPLSELGVCTPCRMQRYKIVGPAPEPETVDGEACERTWAIWQGQHLAPIGRRLTHAERVLLVQWAFEAGVTDVKPIKNLVGLSTADARRLIREVTGT